MKRNYIFDYIVAVILLTALLPMFIIISLILYISGIETVFFTQTRPGKDEELFQILKFKTMTDARNEKGELLPDAMRLTSIGKVLRKLSLDELPQLINVIKGEMALVGPRPLLPEYLPLYNKVQRRRHEVKPGITGWAQVNGRNCISWETKFDYDIWYIDNKSFMLDIKILWLSITKVFNREDISPKNSLTMENFAGSI